VHGRYSYKRIARMVTYFFYKNLAFGLTLFLYNLHSKASGQARGLFTTTTPPMLYLLLLLLGASGGVVQNKHSTDV